MPANPGQHIVINDPILANRLFNVLRMAIDDIVELFDGIRVITIRITDRERKARNIQAQVIEHHMVEMRTPLMTVALCMLKREAMEQAVYSAAQMGACTIVPVVTAKSRHRWSSHTEHERLEKIIAAACEQSKNYAVPRLTEPMPLESYLRLYNAERRIFFDITGKPITDMVNFLESEKPTSLSLIIGPEGGFIPAEIELLKEKELSPFSLTPTILRSRDAACLGIGTVSSVLFKDSPCVKVEKA
mgnify:CR=1 FL=1